MAKLTLETLLVDTKIEILCAFKSYKIFNRYSKSIMTRVIQNIIGKDAWKEATAVLIYQQEIYRIYPDPTVIKKYLETKFVMRVSEFARLASNQQFF